MFPWPIVSKACHQIMLWLSGNALGRTRKRGEREKMWKPIINHCLIEWSVGQWNVPLEPSSPSSTWPPTTVGRKWEAIIVSATPTRPFITTMAILAIYNSRTCIINNFVTSQETRKSCRRRFFSLLQKNPQMKWNKVTDAKLLDISVFNNPYQMARVINY